MVLAYLVIRYSVGMFGVVVAGFCKSLWEPLSIFLVTSRTRILNKEVLHPSQCYVCAHVSLIMKVSTPPVCTYFCYIHNTGYCHFLIHHDSEGFASVIRNVVGAAI